MKPVLFYPLTRQPYFPSRLQQTVGADDVGADKSFRAVDGAVYMTFGRKMNNGIYVLFRQHPAIVFAIANSIGFGLALVLFAGIREHMDLADVPEGMRGVPAALVVAGLLSLAFMGFTGIV